MTDGIVRRLAMLTSVKRTRVYDAERAQRNGEPGRDERVRQALDEITASVRKLEAELDLMP